MERMWSRSKSAHTTIFSNPAHRMSRRPFSVKSGEGRGFEVIDSSLNSKVPNANPSKSKSKAGVKPPPKPRNVPPPLAEDESDDEILLSSQNSTSEHATFTSKRVSEGQKQDLFSEEETVRVDGRILTAHPDYKPSSQEALKRLRFTKNKKSVPSDNVVPELPPPSSSLTDSQDLLKPISDDIEILDGPSSRPSSSLPKPRGETSLTRHRSQSSTVGWAPNAKYPSILKPPAPTPMNAPPAKPRPCPCVVITSTLRKRHSTPESTPRSAAPKRNLPLRSTSPKLPANVGKKRTAKRPFYPSSPPRELREFPMSLQAKEDVSDGSRSGDASTYMTRKPAIPHNGTTVHAPKQIPLPSPLRTKPVSRGNTFLDLSQLSSSIDQGRVRAKSSNEDNTDLPGRQEKCGGPKPFPMSSQMLATVDQPSRLPSVCGPRSTKRLSSDDSGSARGRSVKKRKDSRSGALDMVDHLHEPMEDDSIDVGYARDPSKICPYCDEELPSHPTPLFRHLLATARTKSVSDPRPRNRGGLRAPLTVYISVCQRHRFESHQLPIATERGWPRSIDFTKVPLRVKKMKKTLESIILDKDDISDAEGLELDEEPKGPRNRSVFWKEVKKEVKKQGIRTVVGVKGQFASFEKTQPGYYGEQGSVIIHQTLFDLFPPSTFDASLISPLTPAEFIQRILVPEVAVRLIAQDLCVGIEGAVVTLRESAQYGVAMFPDTSENKRRGNNIDDDEEMGVADRIVMERARARRKELEEEERLEKDMLEKEHAAQRARARESRREKAWERAHQAKAVVKGKVQAEEVCKASEAGGAPRTQPKTVKQVLQDDWKSDTMSVDGSPGKRSTRTAKKKMPIDGRESVRATPTPLNSSDSGSAAKSNVRRNKPRERSSDSDACVKEETAMPCDQKKPFCRLTSIDDDDDGEHESTPRPVRRPTMTATAGSLDARIFPLQAARNRPGMSDSVTCDGWSRNLRTSVPSDTDSDASNASRSRRLVGSSIRKGGSYGWLFSGSSDSPDSS